MVEMADVAGADSTFARQEHRELLAGVQAIREAADAFGWTDNRTTFLRIQRIRDWLSAVLGSHAQWEDAVLYPKIEEKTGSREFIAEWAPGRGIENYVTSATIEATKPL